MVIAEKIKGVVLGNRKCVIRTGIMISSQQRPRKSSSLKDKSEKCWGHIERALEYPNQVFESYFLHIGKRANFGRHERARSQFWEGNCDSVKGQKDGEKAWAW